MLNTNLLREKINDSGITITALADKLGLTRETFYNRLANKSEFKASEIVKLTNILRLTKPERDAIFFN